MKWVVIAVAATALSGCTKSVSEMNYTELKEYAASLEDRCRKQGATAAEMNTCTKQEFLRDYTQREKEREIARALGNAAQSYNQARAARRVNCTSVRTGNVVRTSCR